LHLRVGLLEVPELLIKEVRAVYVVPKVLELEHYLITFAGRSHAIDRFTKSNQKTCEEWN
jgi:hypothetical protein